jgi:hypothetical protein
VAGTHDQDFHLHIRTTSPGGFKLRGALASTAGGYTCTNPFRGAVDCAIRSLSGTDRFTVDYDTAPIFWALDKTSAPTPAYTTTATLTHATTAEAVTSRLEVRPVDDLSVNRVLIDATSGKPRVTFDIRDNGPTGSKRTIMVVTGFKTPLTRVPNVCPTAGTTVICVHNSVTEFDSSEHIVLRLHAGQVGCVYTMRVTGTYPDPDPSNNTLSTEYDPTLGCSATAPAPAPRPTVEPTVVPGSLPPSSPARVAPVVAGSSADAGGVGGSGPPAVIVIAALLAAVGIGARLRRARRRA